MDASHGFNKQDHHRATDLSPGRAFPAIFSGQDGTERRGRPALRYPAFQGRASCLSVKGRQGLTPTGCSRPVGFRQAKGRRQKRLAMIGTQGATGATSQSGGESESGRGDLGGVVVQSVLSPSVLLLCFVLVCITRLDDGVRKGVAAGRGGLQALHALAGRRFSQVFCAELMSSMGPLLLDCQQ